MWLNDDTFATVIRSTPLISIDLVVCNSAGQILLGERVNRPAQGFWFVPGGRILKDETMEAAFRRISKSELGLELSRDAAQFLGLYEHFYADSVFGDGFSTHYVVSGYLVSGLDDNDLNLPGDQHSGFRWWDPADIIRSPHVHQYTKDYLEATGLQPDID